MTPEIPESKASARVIESLQKALNLENVPEFEVFWDSVKDYSFFEKDQCLAHVYGHENCESKLKDCALSAAFELMTPLLHAYLRRMDVQEEDVADILQDVWLSLFVSETFTGPRLLPYLKKAVLNRLIDERQRVYLAPLISDPVRLEQNRDKLDRRSSIPEVKRTLNAVRQAVKEMQKTPEGYNALQLIKSDLKGENRSDVASRHMCSERTVLRKTTLAFDELRHRTHEIRLSEEMNKPEEED
jgi:DNA-directed RNA polymerase specialized sigma24 family protein